MRCCGVNHVSDNVVIMLHIRHPDPRMQDQRLTEYSRKMTVLFFRVWADLELAILGNMRDQLLICIACMLVQPRSTRSRCADTKEREAFLCLAAEAEQSALRHNPALVLVSFLSTLSRQNW